MSAVPCRPGRPWRRLLPWCLAALAPVVAASEAGPAPVALIVRLQGAPAHAAARTQRLDASTLAAQRRLQRQRWQAAWQGAGLASEQGWRLQPVGQASWRLVPGRTLSTAEWAGWRSRLAARPEVAWVEVDTREPVQQALPSPNDPLFAQQWWLHTVAGSSANALADRRRGVPGLQQAWAQGTGSGSTVVAVLDTGITTHPELPSARLLPGFDMVSNWDAASGRGLAQDGDARDADPSDPGDGVSAAQIAADPSRYAGCSAQVSSWHGTTVAGLIAAQTDNASGGAGALWSTRLLPVRVSGQCGATLSDIVDGMRWAAGLQVCQRWADSQDPSAGCAQWAPTNPNPARVINLSFGSQLACGSEYQAAIDELWALGVVVVAPAGNRHAEPARPANCQRVIGVAALNRDGFKANYSNFGSALRIATVGGDDSDGLWGSLLADSGLLAPGNNGELQPGSPVWSAHYGSSFAAPLVTATVGLMLAAAPSLTPAQLLEGLQLSARPHVRSSLVGACSLDNPGRCICTSSQCGAGILDAEQAVAWARATASGSAWQAPNWPEVWVDSSELAQAVALGPDREAVSSTSSGGSGGGAMGLVAGAALALAGALLRPRRRP